MELLRGEIACGAQSLARLGLLVGGKCFTYVFLGAVAAWFGVIVFKNTTLSPAVPYVRLAAGVAIAVMGLSMIGVRLPKAKRAGPPPHPFLKGGGANFAHTCIAPLLRNRSGTSAFVLGLGVGFLPCPLPMGMLAIAAANHHVLSGIALMAGVGVGTAPGLMAVGLFGAGLNRKLARIGMQAAGVLVLAIGLLMFARAADALLRPNLPGNLPPCCCHEHVK